MVPEFLRQLIEPGVDLSDLSGELVNAVLVLSGLLP
jgi:hypothetical protein